MYRIKRKVTADSLILRIYSMFAAFILIYMTYNSFRPKADLLSNTLGIPRRLTLETYINLFTGSKFPYFILGSIIILVFSLALIVMLSSMVAYGIGRFNFRLRKGLLLYFLMGLMFPVQLGIVPIFLIIRSWGLLDTHTGVILVYAAGISMPVLLLTVFFQNLSRDIYESAKIDGASEWRIFQSIMFPMASPVIFSICIIMSVQIWNKFFMPLIFLQSEVKKTIPLGIMKYTQNLMYTVDIAMASSVIATVPILFAFFLFSRKILEGVAAGGVKG